MNRPRYVPEGLSDEPIGFVWKGATAHIGPAPPSGKLLDVVADKTTCATISIVVGIAYWSAWRLQRHAPTEELVDLAEAAFAYQVDWRYCNRDAAPPPDIPDKPPAISAIAKLTSFVRRSVDSERYWNDYYQPIDEAFHAAHIVNHILPKAHQKTFGAWLKAVSDRLAAIAPKPTGFREYSEFKSDEEYNAWVAPHRGEPLPPEVLDPDFKYTAADREDLVGKFLKGLNPKKNRFLRTPETLLEMGFEGTPYKLR
jgi:hypothetical protein